MARLCDADPPAATAGGSPRTDRHADFDEFYAANVRALTGQVYAYTGDFAEAEDLVAEAFCRALARWKQVRGYEHPVAWVRHVAWNLATSHLRRRTVAQRFLRRQREVPAAEGPDGDRVDLVKALAGIGDRHRKALILRYMAQMTAAEIAAQEGVAEATVRSWLTRGKKAVAERLHFDFERDL
ncbi:RNA polymerase sigma factor [Glycomyces paridis]|uniref:RNA polymerase sigma factor n=1 Tax=Glycomyces paridis TaxID=2126555 RepID=UPI001957781A|nr:sigma-70 family RNA polymerase sigma factor [Glycomyces paridis]